MRRSVMLLLVGLAALLAGCTSLQRTGSLPPTAALDAQPIEGPAPLHVTFDAGRSADDIAIADYTWDFGDGSVQPAAESYGWAADHAYTQPGIYTAQVTVTDTNGLTDTATVTIQVVNRPPIAGCRLSNDAPIRYEQVLFDGSGSFDPDGPLVDFVWDFGDGTSMRGTRVGHAYDELGVYTVRLTVTDSNGATASATHVIEVHLGSSGGGCGGSAVSLGLDP